MAVGGRAALYVWRGPNGTHKPPEVQVLELTEAAHQLGLTVVQTFQDGRAEAVLSAAEGGDDLSAEKDGERAGRRSMFAMGETGQCDVVLALDWTYLARSLLDFLKTMQRAVTARVRVHLIAVGFDSHSPAGKRLLGSLDLIEQISADMRSSHARNGVEAARAAGKPVGRPIRNPGRKAEIAVQLRAGLAVTDIARRLGAPPAEVSRIRSELGLPPAQRTRPTKAQPT